MPTPLTHLHTIHRQCYELLHTRQRTLDLKQKKKKKKEKTRKVDRPLSAPPCAEQASTNDGDVVHFKSKSKLLHSLKSPISKITNVTMITQTSYKNINKKTENSMHSTKIYLHSLKRGVGAAERHGPTTAQIQSIIFYVWGRGREEGMHNDAARIKSEWQQSFHARQR